MIQRMVGIMPEKAMKMEAWRIVGGYIEKQYPNAKYTKWLVAGAMAGVATTVVGKLMVCMQSSKDTIHPHRHTHTDT